MWLYNDAPITDEQLEGYVAFVYIIKNKLNGRQYIGKKRLHTKRRLKPLKGKKRKRLQVQPSDWKDYYGSSPKLLTDVETHGKDSFERRILRLCKSLGEASYYEAREQFVNDCLLNPDDWYNDWIMVRVRGDHLKGLRVTAG